MKKINHIVLKLYWIGLNLYLLFWYLGSEGNAVYWMHDGLSFFDLLASINLGAVLSLLAFLQIPASVYNPIVDGVRWMYINFIFQCLIITLLFLVINSTFLCILSDFNSLMSYLKTSHFLSLMIYHFALSVVLILFLNILPYLRKSPKALGLVGERVEKAQQVSRGFMFLDLNDSTDIAERLGHRLYSSLLRECFEDLEQLIDLNPGFEVYQFVGDEAVLYWDFGDSNLSYNASRLFEEFKQTLDSRKEHFLSRYGISPYFKCALHGGTVTQSELGKRVIHMAFHGDVLNTTSRILGLCHKYKTDLLLSEEYFERVRHNIDQPFTKVSDVRVNGKVHALTLYKPGSMRIRLDEQKQENFLFESKMTDSQ